MDYILGIDVGTSNVKAVLFDENGTEVKVASRESETINDGGNWEEQDMTQVWLKVKSCVRELMDSGTVDKNEINDIIYKIEVINEFLYLIQFNVNMNLFIDNFVISMGGYFYEESCRG